MPRTTDDPSPPPPSKPLGERVTAPPPSKPAPQGVGPSGIVTDAEGRMHTTTHKPHGW